MPDFDVAKIEAPKAPKDEAAKPSGLNKEFSDYLMAGFPKHSGNMANQVNECAFKLSATKDNSAQIDPLKSETPSLDLSVPIDSNAKPDEQKKETPTFKLRATEDGPAKPQENKKETPSSKLNETEDAPAKSQEDKSETPSFKLKASENVRAMPEEQKRETSKPESIKHRKESDQIDERREKPESKSDEAQHQKYEANSAEKARQSDQNKSAEANQKKENQSVEENRKKDETKSTDTNNQRHHPKLDTIAEIDANTEKHALQERHTMNQLGTIVQDFGKLSLEGQAKVVGAFAQTLLSTMAKNVVPTMDDMATSFEKGCSDQNKKYEALGKLCEDIGNGKFETALGNRVSNEVKQIGQVAQQFEENPTATALQQLADLTQDIGNSTQGTLTFLDKVGNRAMYDPEQFGLNGIRLIPEVAIDTLLAVATLGTGDAAEGVADGTADLAPEVESTADSTAAENEVADASPSTADPDTPEDEGGSEKSEEGEDSHERKEKQKLVRKVLGGHEHKEKQSESKEEQKEAGEILRHSLKKLIEHSPKLDVDEVANGNGILPHLELWDGDQKAS